MNNNNLGTKKTKRNKKTKGTKRNTTKSNTTRKVIFEFNTPKKKKKRKDKKEMFVLSAHGSVYPYNPPINIKDKNIEVVFYTDFGGTCFATNRDPNLICNKTYKKRRNPGGHDRARKFTNMVPDLFFWPLKTTMESHSGVKRCGDNKIILNFDRDYPDKIMPWDLYACRPYKIFLSDVIKIISLQFTKKFELHILTCLDMPYDYDRSLIPIYS